MLWLIVAVTPIDKRCFIRLLDCSAILFASSLIVITSGILISLFTGFKSSSSSFLFSSLFSFFFALFKEAKLLALNSISSSLSALDTVSFSSLLFEPIFPFWALSPFNLFVALCSASFLFSKSFAEDGFEVTGSLGTKLVLDLLNVFLWWVLLEKEGFDPNLVFFFSITTEFLPYDFANSILFIVFFELPEIDNFNFFFSIHHLSIFINFFSGWHN